MAKKRRTRLEQLPLFASTAPPPATDARAAEAARRKKEREKSRRAYFAGRASALASRSKEQTAETRPAAGVKRAELRETVLGLLCAEDARVWDVARRAGVTERYVEQLVAEAFDRKRLIRAAIAVERTISPLPASAPRSTQLRPRLAEGRA